MLIFLDIDGVLNGHSWNDAAQSNTIDRECVTHLNRILRETGAGIVLSSAWRYMIHGGAVTTTGFEYLLRTHGVRLCKIVGITPRDEEVTGRGAQISAWLASHGNPAPYVVVDDEAYDIADDGHPLVRTDGKYGLTAEDADSAIAILKAEEPLIVRSA